MTRDSRAEGERLAAAPVRWHHEDDDTIDLAPYILALRERWRTIAGAALATALATALVTGLVLPRWYRAKAVIRPIATPAVESRIAGVLGGLGGGFGLSGLAASLGAGGNNDAEEYIAIMRGFQFNLNLAEHHHLSKKLLKPGLLGLIYSPKIKDPAWAIYRVLEKRFDCEYSIRTGNITLYFQAKSRVDAQKILGYYIGDLRNLLRAREITGASAAIESLEAEAKTTPDAVLRTDLYELIAKQVERRKMAQVEADFAFRVLDPPAASDRHYRPWITLDAILACLIVGSIAALAVALRNHAGNIHVSRS